eukprot:2248439-Pleurochrysis_carterae.AAC.1
MDSIRLRARVCVLERCCSCVPLASCEGPPHVACGSSSPRLDDALLTKHTSRSMRSAASRDMQSRKICCCHLLLPRSRVLLSMFLSTPCLGAFVCLFYIVLWAASVFESSSSVRQGRVEHLYPVYAMYRIERLYPVYAMYRIERLYP